MIPTCSNCSVVGGGGGGGGCFCYCFDDGGVMSSLFVVQRGYLPFVFLEDEDVLFFC
jgi:hypothetical protein